MEHALPELAYATDALVPYLSPETFEYHYGKHHRTYVKNLNQLIKDTHFEDIPLEKIIQTATGGIFNNAAQHWNHSFYWGCLCPAQQQSLPSSSFLKDIEKKWGDFESFKAAFKKAALGQFASGWAWLIKTKEAQLDIITTSNAQTPLSSQSVSLLTCDVWEHAYYIDYRNDRGAYIDQFWSIVNWSAVEKKWKAV